MMSEHAQEWFTALQQGDMPAVERLLAADASLLHARDANGISSVMWTCYARQAGARARLLADGPELDVFEAVAAGESERARDLLAGGGEIANAWSPDGFTPLHLAAFFSHAGIAAHLLALGAHTRAVARNATRVEPLHSAAAAGATDIARLLLQHGADANARQVQGFTALMSAAQQGNDALADLLLSHGADPAARCDDGRAAADFADLKAHHALAARLRGAGG
jgi:ankyrin repeat protein